MYPNRAIRAPFYYGSLVLGVISIGVINTLLHISARCTFLSSTICSLSLSLSLSVSIYLYLCLSLSLSLSLCLSVYLCLCLCLSLSLSFFLSQSQHNSNGDENHTRNTTSIVIISDPKSWTPPSFQQSIQCNILIVVSPDGQLFDANVIFSNPILDIFSSSSFFFHHYHHHHHHLHFLYSKSK